MEKKDIYFKATKRQEKTEVSCVLMLKKLFLKIMERGLMEQILED